MSETVPDLFDALLSSIGPRLDEGPRADVLDWIAHREWALAVDVLAEALDDAGVRLVGADRLTFTELLRRIDYDPAAYAYLYE